MNSADSFYQLTPNDVLNCMEEAGFMPTGEFQQLNSYENRVFNIHLETEDNDNLSTQVVAKFYRPGRWNKESLLDEHTFLQDLKYEGIPAIAPLLLKDEKTLMESEGIFFSVFPKFFGRMPQEFLEGELKTVGRTLARIHNIGAQRTPNNRLFMHPEEYGWNYLDELCNKVDQSLWGRYKASTTLILEFLEDHLDEDQFIRIHGDCHKGNLLHNGDEFFFVDFDDFLSGPVAQDFWMLLSDSAEEREEILAGYEELRPFPQNQFQLFEPLRGLRILHYAAWIARRWSDPSFPRLFPDFGSYHYWAEETEALEKIAWGL